MTAVIPRISGASLAERKIVVGPSAPPIMPIEAASESSKTPVARAPPECDEYTDLRRRSEQQGLGIGYYGAKIC